MTHRLDSRRAAPDIVAAVAKIEQGIARLDPELETGFERAKVALAGQTSLIAIQDARRELEGAAAAFPGWKEKLEAEAKRTAEVIAEITKAEGRW
ncbi:MAG: hypothetical protein ABR587_16210, partial [Candidatus Binatia bacterium]